jgi:glyoxylate/succinic semialdehyde reductase
MTAGDEALASEVAGEMDAMGKASHYCGETGAASKMKLVVNMIMGGMIAALAEGIALSQALALDGGQMQQILEQGAMSSPMLKLKGPNMAEGVHPSAFPLKYAQKDMRFALAEAGRAGLVLPVAKAASDEMVASMDQGNGDADFSAVVEALRGARRG